MRRSPSRLLLVGFLALFLVMVSGSITTVDAQTSDPIADGKLSVSISLDGMEFSDYNLTDALPINMEEAMMLDMHITNDWTLPLNVSGKIIFFYQGFAIAPIEIKEAGTNRTWFPIPVNTTTSLPEPQPMDFSEMMNVLGPIDLATGIFEVTIDFEYYVEGNTTKNHLKHKLAFDLPSGPLDVITSVTGITTIVFTASAGVGVVTGINSLFDGIKTAYKLRGIQKKASEIKSLPNLTVLGALPLLFSLLDGMKKAKKSGREDSGVSEYIVRQRLREVAPDAWQVDKCPQCKRKWNKNLDMCKKCNLTQDEARQAYAELLSEKVPKALRWMGKKKSTDVKTLAKKTKSTQYNAGVIAAAMVDTEVTEITKVGTPLRSFVMNVAGLAFLVVTWQQLLGDRTSTFQTTITMVGAALSLAVIVALYFARKTQIEKFVADQDAGKKILPTEEEAEAEAESEVIEDETPEIDEEEPSGDAPENTQDTADEEIIEDESFVEYDDSDSTEEEDVDETVDEE